MSKWLFFSFTFFLFVAYDKRWNKNLVAKRQISESRLYIFILPPRPAFTTQLLLPVQHATVGQIILSVLFLKKKKTRSMCFCIPWYYFFSKPSNNYWHIWCQKMRKRWVGFKKKKVLSKGVRKKDFKNVRGGGLNMSVFKREGREGYI